MATRLIGVDSEDPKLPDSVIAATVGTTAADFAAGDAPAAVQSAAAAYTDTALAVLPVSATVAFRRRLDAAAGPAVVTLLGDSTGNNDTDWFTPVFDDLAAAHPEWTARRRLWSDTTQGYDAAHLVQIGTGGEAYMTPIASVGGASAPDDTAAAPTGADVMILAKIRTPASGPSEAVIGGQYGASGNRAYYAYLSGSGGGTRLTFRMVNGGATQTDYHGDFTALPTSTDVYIGGRFTGATGTWQPLTSTNGVTWSALGAGTTGTTQSDFGASTEAINIGARSTSAGAGLPRIYWVEAFDGDAITDRVLWRFDAGMWVTGTSWTGDDGRTWTLATNVTVTQPSPLLLAMNGSHPGATIAYAEDSTRQPKLIAAPTNLLVMNWGHNETAVDVQATYKALVDGVRAAWPSTGIVVCRQNPESTGYANHARQNRHQANIAELAAREGWSVIDAFKAFLDTGDPDELIADGVHPTQAGYDLWSNVARRAFALAEA